MSDDAQMILLSALMACLCLVGVVACVAAVNDAPITDDGYLSSGSMENILWAQDNALQKAAYYSSAGRWDSRAEAALRFKADVNRSMESLSEELFKHRVAYIFVYNESLADEYVAIHGENDTESIGGTLVGRSGGNIKIVGCAYDVAIDDGVSRYHMSRVEMLN